MTKLFFFRAGTVVSSITCQSSVVNGQLQRKGMGFFSLQLTTDH
jgi:hypothetical protein